MNQTPMSEDMSEDKAEALIQLSDAADMFRDILISEGASEKEAQRAVENVVKESKT